MLPNFSVYVLIPVHNRKAITLRCLNHLAAQGGLDLFQIVVIDDGSTDGTPDAIRTNFSNVKILSGDGNLWWTGAIAKGMQFAYSQGAEYFIWLNDDCLPEPTAIEQLVQFCQNTPKQIAGAQSYDPDTKQPSYGGFRKRWNRIEPVNVKDQETLSCDGLSGNLVCIPRSAVDSIGYPNARIFPQYYCDVVYTYEAKQHGFSVCLLGHVMAYCKDDHSRESWLKTQRNWQQVWTDRYSIKHQHYWKAHLAYLAKLLGPMGVIKYVYDMHIRFFGIFMIRSFIK
ncbi:glycosyltransferase family 2 protein [filamentous cyanobacterium CCP5]|nr:glycosyltransferase family 2 protein [filamentous cyanobacterium CCP5]